jgi:tRNA 2-thiouridine synthesizing protein A
MLQQVKVDRIVDARGVYCPGPLMELIRLMRMTAVGTTFEVLSSDEISTQDIPEWTMKSGHEYIGVEKKRDHWSVFVKKTR